MNDRNKTNKDTNNQISSQFSEPLPDKQCILKKIEIHENISQRKTVALGDLKQIMQLGFHKWTGDNLTPLIAFKLARLMSIYHYGQNI